MNDHSMGSQYSPITQGNKATVSVYMVIHVGRDVGKLFYFCTFMHSSRKINAEIVPDVQTHEVGERLWGEDTACCFRHIAFSHRWRPNSELDRPLVPQ